MDVNSLKFAKKFALKQRFFTKVFEVRTPEYNILRHLIRLVL
jgi:hypothetical protein